MKFEASNTELPCINKTNSFIKCDRKIRKYDRCSHGKQIESVHFTSPIVQ